MSLTFVPCTPEFLAAIIPPNPEGVEDTRGNILDDPAQREMLRIYARALLKEGVPIAVMGISKVWTGRGYAWAIFTDAVLSSHKLSLARETKRLLKEAEDTLGMRRIEASVRAGLTTAEEWIETFGFKREGLMHNFGPGGKGDFWLYARTVE